jgi:hypothetical protein
MSNAVGAGVKPAPTASFAVSACLPAETNCFRLDYAAGFLILSDVEVIEGLPVWPVTLDPLCFDMLSVARQCERILA